MTEALTGYPLPNGARFAFKVQLVLEDLADDLDTSAWDDATRAVFDGIANALGYGLHTGFRRLLDVLDEQGCPASVSTAGVCAERRPDLVREMADRGHEIVGHAYSLGQDPALMTAAQDRDTIERTLDVIERASGQRPVGWASAAARRGDHTVENLLRAGVIHTNDFREADVPFVAGRLGDRRLVAMPRTDEINDNYALRNAGHSPANYVDYFKRAFDRLHEESATRPGRVLTLVAHSTTLGHPWGAGVLEECCAYARRPEVWVATSAEIARHYLAQEAAA